MPRVTRRHYAEQLDWWAASGWAMEVEDLPDGGLFLRSRKKTLRLGFASWGGRATGPEVATPAQVRHFLTETLYYHLHPRKASAAYAAMGQIATEKELAAFIRQQRRKVALLDEARRGSK